jgi:hypothetical protein
MIVSSTILAFVATTSVVLRVWARRLARLSLGLDDYLVILALMIHHAILVSSIMSVTRGGLGRDIRIVAAENPNAMVVLFQVSH